MAENCITCHGTMAHYAMLPSSYCVTHLNWMDKCASVDCVTNTKVAGQNPNGYFICPTDGSIREAARIPSSVFPIPTSGEDPHKEHRKQLALDPTLDKVVDGKTGDEAAEALTTHLKSRPTPFQKMDADNLALHQADELARKMKATGAVDVEALIPMLDPTYPDETRGHKADDIENRPDGSGNHGSTLDHEDRVLNARENAKAMADNPAAMELINRLPAAQRLEEYNKDHRKVNVLNEIGQDRDSIIRGMGIDSGITGITEGTDSVSVDSGIESRAASFEKEAMWYYLKPRWILRRKAQAIIRNKIRTVVKPVTTKLV